MNSFIEREDYCLEKCFFSFTHIKGNLDNKTFVLVYSLSMCSFKSCMKGLSLDWKQQKKHVPMQGTSWTTQIGKNKRFVARVTFELICNMNSLKMT